MPFFIHKHEVSQEYGGPEEGGWYFDTGYPVAVTEWDPQFHRFFNRGDAQQECYKLNQEEKERRKREEDYEYTSVLSHRSTFYAYSVSENPTPEPYPKERPHYE